MITADNGEDAVTRFREHGDISLVLSDVVMPRKNGKELLDEIRMIKPANDKGPMNGKYYVTASMPNPRKEPMADPDIPYYRHMPVVRGLKFFPLARSPFFI